MKEVTIIPKLLSLLVRLTLAPQKPAATLAKVLHVQQFPNRSHIWPVTTEMWVMQGWQRGTRCCCCSCCCSAAACSRIRGPETLIIFGSLGLLQLQHADKTLLCKWRDEGEWWARGPTVRGDVCVMRETYVRRVPGDIV